jgi:hypothetical protein
LKGRNEGRNGWNRNIEMKTVSNEIEYGWNRKKVEDGQELRKK